MNQGYTKMQHGQPIIKKQNWGCTVAGGLLWTELAANGCSSPFVRTVGLDTDSDGVVVSRQVTAGE